MPGEPCIFVLSKAPRNAELLVEFIEQQGYAGHGAVSLDELDQALDRGSGIDLALLDLSGLDSSLWDRCERLHRLGIPFLIISPRHSAAVARESAARGARATLTKPLVMREIATLIRALLEE